MAMMIEEDEEEAEEELYYKLCHLSSQRSYYGRSSKFVISFIFHRIILVYLTFGSVTFFFYFFYLFIYLHTFYVFIYLFIFYKRTSLVKIN